MWRLVDVMLRVAGIIESVAIPWLIGESGCSCPEMAGTLCSRLGI